MKIKNIIPLAVVLMLVLPGLAVVADEPTQEKKNLTIEVRGINGEDYSIQMEITYEQFQFLSQKVNDTLDLINDTISKNSPDGINISDSEWDEVEISTNEIVDSIKEIAGNNFPKEMVESCKEKIANVIHLMKYVKDSDPESQGIFGRILGMLLGTGIWRQPLLSIGIGWTLIPHYEYETFLGKMIRPIWMRQVIGFSATGRIFRPSFVYWNFGCHRAMTFLFNGLFINFGDLGRNTLIGPQLLVGVGSITHFPHT